MVGFSLYAISAICLIKFLIELPRPFQIAVGIFILTVSMCCSFYFFFMGGFRSYGNLFGKFLQQLGVKKTISFFGPRVSFEFSNYCANLIEAGEFPPEQVEDFHNRLANENLIPLKKDKFLLFQLNRLTERFSADRKIDDSEWAIFLKARKYFNSPIPENDNSGLTKVKLGDWRARGIVSEGRLIHDPDAKLPIKMNLNEKVFLVVPSLLVKRRTKTSRVGYSGLSTSINLGAGIRYRIGSFKPQVVRQEYVSTEDRGTFFVTSDRVGFHGDRKSVSIEVKKLNDVQVESDVGLEIFKQGRENPILIYPADLDFSAAVLNLVLNGDYEIDQGKVAI